MHQISERDIEQVVNFAESNDEGALRALLDQLTSIEVLKISDLKRERDRVFEELRSKIIARVGENSPAVGNLDTVIARMTQMSTRSIPASSIQYRNL
jgi:rRNA processing protein Krr1/Pno1